MFFRSRSIILVVACSLISVTMCCFLYFDYIVLLCSYKNMV